MPVDDPGTLFEILDPQVGLGTGKRVGWALGPSRVLNQLHDNWRMLEPKATYKRRKEGQQKTPVRGAAPSIFRFLLKVRAACYALVNLQLLLAT